MQLLHGGCLELMKDIPDKSVDMILCDLPYGTTKNKFDKIISFNDLWIEYKRVIKDNGAIVLFSQQPFTTKLIASNLEMFKYEWIWEKAMPTGRLNVHFAPLKCHENICVFAKKAACYVKDVKNAMNYYPQMTEGKPYKSKSGSKSTNYDTKWCKETITINNGTRYPRDVIKFNHDRDKYHPTQKPVSLLEYLIKTYTSEGGVVLDNCMGSGSTGIACINTNRNFIGIELDDNYYEIAKKRIEEHQKIKGDIKMNIKKNPDNAKYEEVTQAVKDNDGYCPCDLQKNEDTKCMCKAFKESKDKGECHCGRFVKE